MKFIKFTALLLTAGLIAVSCGDSDDEPYDVKESRSFERWISMYINTDPANPAALKLENGGYIQWLYSPGSTEAPVWGDYVQINYKGMYLSDWDFELEKGSVFMNRWEDEAERLGTWTAYTHYIPQMILNSRILNSYDAGIMGGISDAVQMMKVGDMVRLYLPSAQSSSSSSLTMEGGYQGNKSKPTDLVPVIVELELAGIVDQPQTAEELFVIDYAADKWNKTVADTVRQYVFLNVDKSTTTSDKAAADSSLVLYYKAMLAYDDFPLSTNIDTVAQRWGRSATSYTTYKPSTGTDHSDTYMAIQALSEVFESGEITYGCEFEFITTSQFAFGAAGVTPASGTTEILPYQPVKYWVMLEEYDKE